jgi:hypothetical protein
VLLLLLLRRPPGAAAARARVQIDIDHILID